MSRCSRTTAFNFTATGGATDTYLAPRAPGQGLYDGETMTGSVWLRSLTGTQTVNLYLVEYGSAGYNIPAYKPVTVTQNWQQFQVSGQYHYGYGTLIFQIGGAGTISSGQALSIWGTKLEDSGTSGRTITNALAFSQRFTTPAWSLNASLTDNSATAPDGTNTAATATATGNDSYFLNWVRNPAPYTGQSITGSVWMRSPSGPQTISATLLVDGNVPVGTLYASLNTTWQRFQVTTTSSSTLNELALQIGGAGTFANGQSFQIWGAQIELASNAGPYVATGGTAASIGTNLTNLLPYSQQPNGPSWVSSGVLGNINSVIAPDGSMTGAEYTATSGSGDGYLYDNVANPALYDGATVTGSVFLRAPNGSQSLNVYLVGGNASGRTYLGAQPFQLTDHWQRFKLTGQLPKGLINVFFQVGGAGSLSAGQTIDLWGAQLELASTAGPYVVTSALPVIAGKELVNMLSNSQQLSGPTWGVANGSITGTNGVAPDGTSTAATLTASSNSPDTYAIDFVANPSLYDAQTVTASVYLRVPSGTLNTYLFLVNQGQSGFTAPNVPVTVTSNWQRFSITTQNQNGLTSLALQIGGAATLTSGSLQIWGAQMVLGSAAAPYMPTPSTTTVPSTGQPATPLSNGLNQSFSYDSFGNLLQNGSFNDNYTANNQMIGYAYDAAGNLLSDGVSAMSWNAESRLAASSGATYLYDAEGNRVEKQGVGVTDTVYFGGQPIARLSAGSWTDLIYGPTGLLAEVPGTENADPVYRLGDHLGTDIGTVAANGLLTNPTDYTPFGQLAYGLTNDPYAFTGLERDPESGFDYTPNRQYSSRVGRWLSPDPYDGSYDLGNPQSLNRYNYVGNNPLRYTDPSGQDPCAAAETIGSAFGPEGSAIGLGVCIGEIVYSVARDIEDILGLFYHPKFTSSHTPRPHAIWDEHGGYQPHADIAGALGLPSGECEFGACGGGFTQGSGNSTVATLALPSLGFYNLLSLFHFPYHDASDPNHRLFGTHYCGPGGGGDTNSGVDQLCAGHDACYKRMGMTGLNTINPFSSGAAMGGCDRLLCASLHGYQSSTSQERSQKASVQYAFGCSYISKE